MDAILNIIKAFIANASLDSPYTDMELQKIAIAVANLLIPEFGYNQEFHVDFSNFIIVPDPDPSNQQHNMFINLVALKAVINLSKAEAKKFAIQGKIKVSDSPASVEISDRYQSMQTLVKNLEEEYYNLKYSYMFHGNLGGYSPQAIYNLGRRIC